VESIGLLWEQEAGDPDGYVRVVRI